MADTLTLYTNPQSRGRIARWMLEETGVPYETKILGYVRDMKDDAYLALNPMGKVPTLTHGDTVVTECAAICAYLADVFPDAGLAPPPEDRGAYYRWLFYAAGPLEAAVSNHAAGFDPAPEMHRMFGYGTYEAVIDTLDATLTASPYIAGDRFSAADVYLGSHIGFGMQFGTMESRPAFTQYWERVSDRDAHRRANELDAGAQAELDAQADATSGGH